MPSSQIQDRFVSRLHHGHYSTRGFNERMASRVATIPIFNDAALAILQQALFVQFEADLLAAYREQTFRETFDGPMSDAPQPWAIAAYKEASSHVFSRTSNKSIGELLPEIHEQFLKARTAHIREQKLQRLHVHSTLQEKIEAGYYDSTDICDDECEAIFKADLFKSLDLYKCPKKEDLYKKAVQLAAAESDIPDKASIVREMEELQKLLIIDR